MDTFSEEFAKMSNKSTKDNVESRRHIFQTEYESVLKLLQPLAETFFAKHAASSTSETFPAVDIGSGDSIGTATLALTLRPPILPEETELLWYPTDWNGNTDDVNYKGGPLKLETQETLRYLVQESEEMIPLFIDCNGRSVFNGECIELNGLNAARFNGGRGYIKGVDLNDSDRFQIQLSSDPNDRKSFKKEHISYTGAPTLHDAMLRGLREDKEAKELFEGLLNRTREVDILKHETWSNVKELYGKCALVTCTSLLTCIGYSDPTAWKDTMQLASQLLHIDGYLLQYDAVGHADFGDTSIMQEFAQDESLGLTLEEATIPPNSYFGTKKRKIIIWKKI